MQTEHFHYTYLPNDIHRLTFLKASRIAVVDYFICFAELLNHHEHRHPLRLLFDLRPAGYPPINAVMSEARRFYRTYSLPIGTREAYLHHPDAVITMANALFNSLRLQHSERRFFEEREQEAVAWLQAPF